MLDIIIPTYKNPEGLRRTLRSIDYITSEITITVISDGDHMETDYRPIFEEFPFANLWVSESNRGPGATRELGLSATTEPYITFIDTDDYFLPQMLSKVVKEIRNNPNIYEFRYCYTNKKGVCGASKNNHMHSIIYKRSFLEQYDAHFCCNPIGSYANEDIGFNRYLRMILRDLEAKTKKNYIKYYNTSLVYWTDDDKNSLTRNNEHIFTYTRHSMGLAENEIMAIEKAENFHVNHQLIVKEVGTIMSTLYTIFLKTLYEKPEYALNPWQGAKFYYDKIYNKYEQEALVYSQQSFSPKIRELREKYKGKQLKTQINITRFVNDLKNFSDLPEHYI